MNAALSAAQIALQLRVVEAILFAAKEPLDEATITLHLKRGEAGEGADVAALLYQLQNQYQEQQRGFMLLHAAGRWSLRSAPDLAAYLRTETTKPMKLSRAMNEVLAIVAYHQPVTRAEIEAIRGVATSKGTLDFLMEIGWVRPGRRRETAGKPLTFITTPAFLDHFGLGTTSDLPALSELRAAGLLDAKGTATYGVVHSSDDAILMDAVEDNAVEEPDFIASAETLAHAAEADTDEEHEVDSYAQAITETDEEESSHALPEVVKTWEPQNV